VGHPPGALAQQFHDRRDEDHPDQVARAAEVDPALVYHYFGDKAQLFAATLDLGFDPLVPGRTHPDHATQRG
jgi:Bacterial regulatory proteins, tetR family